MPSYDYRCRKCDAVFEAFHSIAERSVPACPGCRSKKTKKLISACHFTVRNTFSSARKIDRLDRQRDMKTDLLENHGIESITPLQNESFENVYNTIKGSGSMAKEQMDRSKEKNQQKQDEKKKDRQRTISYRRLREKHEIIREHKARKQAKERAITL